MCRIVGFWDFDYKGEYDIQEVALHMRDTLAHGGPDDAGLFVSPNEALALGHRRLSILDLSPLGHQPMEFENFVIVYNGEVYNFMEIRKELERNGYNFLSNSDTEVILKAFHRWGIDCVHRFRGMWAFAIWDKEEKMLILCRDRIGVKPLYWYYQNNLFMFASELKAFHKHPKFKKELNETALGLYLQYGYIKSPYCVFKNTYKLEPGHFLFIKKDGSITKKKYWDVKNFFVKGAKTKRKWFKKDEEEIIQQLEDILTESFKLRLVSDVPVGIFLSGGIDSSLVTTLLQKETTRPLKTFTIGFHEKGFNEAEWAKKIANFLGTEHTELYCTPEEAYKVIFKLPELYDEPFGDASAIPTYLVSKLAKEKVTVALSADGGDELFYGYTRHWFATKNLPFGFLLRDILKILKPEVAERIYESLSFLFPKIPNFKERYVKFLNYLGAKKILERYDLLCKYFLPEEVLFMGLGNIKTNIENLSLPTRLSKIQLFSLIDILTYLPDDILVKTDRATMGVALEGREPFLDNKIVEFAVQIPDEIKFKNGEGKYPLKQILKKYLPSELIERPKQGFDVPIFGWFLGSFKEMCYEYILSKNNLLFDNKKLENILNDFFKKRKISAYKVWFLLVFSMWYERWM